MKLSFVEYDNNGTYILSSYKRTKKNEPLYSFGAATYIDKLRKRFSSAIVINKKNYPPNLMIRFRDKADDAAFQLYIHSNCGIEL